MTNRKILYGYQIQRGELVIRPQEAVVAKRIVTLYMDGLSYQKIADTLNADDIPFSEEAPLWNKHKVKRLLENPRYAGADGYPAIIDNADFQSVQFRIREKTAGHTKREKRPALLLKDYLRCSCGQGLRRVAGRTQKADALYFWCDACKKRIALSDQGLLSEVSRQITDHDRPAGENYIPSSEVVRLTNAINRGLEHPDHPEEIAASILQGVSARYECCSAPTESDTFNRPAEVDFKHFGQAVSYIAISDGTVTVHFK